MSWKLLYIGPESDLVLLGGVSLWGRQWKTQGEQPISVQHPVDQLGRVDLDRYFIEAGGRAREFAARKQSSGDWVIFVPDRTFQYQVILSVTAYGAASAGGALLYHGAGQSKFVVGLGAALIAVAVALERVAKKRYGASEA